MVLEISKLLTNLFVEVSEKFTESTNYQLRLNDKYLNNLTP